MSNAGRSGHPDQLSSAVAQPIGEVVSVRGSKATVGLLSSPTRDTDGRPTVGRFLGIRARESLLVGVITNVCVEAPAPAKGHRPHSTADLDLVGEIKQTANAFEFQRGVADYPAIGDPVFPV